MEGIKCPRCATEIEIDKALERQIESRVLIRANERHQQELAQVKKEAMIQAERRVQERLRGEVSSVQADNKGLREELGRLHTSLMEERRAKEEAELKARRRLAEEATGIREEARKSADEAHRFKEMELQRQLDNTKKALDDALRKAEQGSEQIQGEVMELELEDVLRRGFPLDAIEEVKKGARGADVLQRVTNQRMDECGVLLWESKNAKWQPAWVAKIKDDLRQANAAVGIIVSKEMPEIYGDMKNVESNVWVVKPKLVLALAAALRATLLQVHTANRNTENKDGKMEALYQFLTGSEFRNRIEAIVDNYSALQKEMDKERRAAELRWARQEKAIQAVIGNTVGLYGDLQGITGSKLQQIPMLAAAEEE